MKEILEYSCVPVVLVCENRRRNCLFIHMWGGNSIIILNFRIQYMPFNCYNSQLNCLNLIQSIDFKIELYNSSKLIAKLLQILWIHKRETVKKIFKRKLKMCHASLGDFGLTFAYAGRTGTHEFNQIGLGFAHPCARACEESLYPYNSCSCMGKCLHINTNLLAYFSLIG